MNKAFCLAATVMAMQGAALADVFTLSADGAVGASLAATPSALVPTGTGASATPYTYDLGANDLDMDAFKITSAGSAYHAAFILGSLSYDEGDASGGVFDFSGPSYRGNLKVEAAGSISIRAIDTSSTSRVGSSDRPGSITLMAPDGIWVAATLRAVQTGNEYPGHVSATAANGPVVVGGLIDTGRSRRPGNVTITAETISVDEIWAGAGSPTITCYGGKVSLAATVGDVAVSGSINNWCAQEAAGGGDVVIEAAGDVAISGGITNLTHRAADAGTKGAGHVSIDAGGSISIGAGVNSSVVHASAVRGNLALTAGDAIGLATLDVGLHGDISISAARGTTIDGPLLGLDEHLDAEAMTVGRFTAVTGHIVYDPDVPENVYLDGGTYAITASVGGTYLLKPPAPERTLITLR